MRTRLALMGVAPVHHHDGCVEPAFEELPVGLELQRVRHDARGIREHAILGDDGVTFDAARMADAARRAAHTTVPNKAPTPAVSPMASAPQNVTRITLGMTLARPARAANTPKSARKTSELPDTKTIRLAAGAKADTTRGMAAPTAKLAADASAA